ncbi:HAD-like domain-containing protein [Chaetomium fimeti]|uniref:HAD-like domain-containing protein n=1 Tax=Chaetomium fimeti TaxID=1854472 RepID=A0AAE0H6E6_9PEZI|nr:HAD-like domain-containing protein [Chaetomium fimeti]
MTIIAFDLYGTLLSTESIAGELAKIVGDEHSKTLAALWRRYQLEYTWRITSMGQFQTFETLTRSSLEHAAAELSLPLTPSDTSHLLEAYNALPVFPDVPPAFETIRALTTPNTTPNPTTTNPPLQTYAFSNGSRHTISGCILSSPGLGACAETWSGFVSVGDVGVYKPAARAYEYLLERVRRPAREVWVVSSNPFDVVGALAAGLRAAWVDRKGTGWVDRLGEGVGGGGGGGGGGDGAGGVRPEVVVGGVDEAVGEILRVVHGWGAA